MPSTWWISASEKTPTPFTNHGGRENYLDLPSSLILDKSLRNLYRFLAFNEHGLYIALSK